MISRVWKLRENHRGTWLAMHEVELYNSTPPAPCMQQLTNSQRLSLVSLQRDDIHKPFWHRSSRSRGMSTRWHCPIKIKATQWIQLPYNITKTYLSGDNNNLSRRKAPRFLIMMFGYFCGKWNNRWLRVPWQSLPRFVSNVFKFSFK